MLDERLLFIGYMSFYNNMDFIKKIFNSLDRNDRYIYKYYIYAQRYLDEKTCDLIWRYLNSIDELQERQLVEELSHRLSRFRGDFK